MLSLSCAKPKGGSSLGLSPLALCHARARASHKTTTIVLDSKHWFSSFKRKLGSQEEILVIGRGKAVSCGGTGSCHHTETVRTWVELSPHKLRDFEKLHVCSGTVTLSGVEGVSRKWPCGLFYLYLSAIVREHPCPIIRVLFVFLRR